MTSRRDMKECEGDAAVLVVVDRGDEQVGGGVLRCALEVKTWVATALEVYTDEEEDVRCRTRDVPQFAGKTTVET